ncbi:MAG TPA: hypothetical protein VK034_21640 [Enhygromyxa sp.]|nr:hypothetical protein [Enhygromyxa sp.]
MTASRLLPLCVVLLSLACAGSKNPSTDEGPAASGDGGKAADDEGAPVAEAGDEGDQPGACSSDADCVPAECCHPTSCVPASQAPDCSDTFCTEECRGGTMDCGQGHCACQDGTCTAVIDNPI